MCVYWWIELISIGELRRISYREKERRRWSLRRGGIPGRIGFRIIDLGGTLQGSPDQPTLRQLMLCFENQCNRFWKRLRTSRSSDDRIRWQEILWIVTKTFTANIIRIMDIPPRIAEICGTLWNNWSERGSWNTFCITLVAEEAKRIWRFGEMLLRDLLWAP